MVQLGNRRLRVLPTCSWASHDLEDCKTLQQQLGVFHLVVVAREVEELPDLLACSPRPATLPEKRTKTLISDALTQKNYFIDFSNLCLLLTVSWPIEHQLSLGGNNLFRIQLKLSLRPNSQAISSSYAVLTMT